MEHIILQATRRDMAGTKAAVLRRQGKLPAVLYGHRIETTPILLDAYEASQMLPYLALSSLVTIDLNGKQFLAQVKEKQRNFLKNRLAHVDFQVVSLTAMMHAKVGIKLSGTAPAVKDYNAEIHTGLTALEVECIPGDLPERITVDISGLAEIGDSVCVRDVVLAGQVKILADPKELIAMAAAPRKEEISLEAPVADEAAPQETERAKKDKKD